jgi:hypothetical protein
LRTLYARKFVQQDYLSAHATLLHPTVSESSSVCEDALRSFVESAFPNYAQKDQSDESYSMCLLDAQEQLQVRFELLPEESFLLSSSPLHEHSLVFPAALSQPQAASMTFTSSVSAAEEPEGLFMNILLDKLAGALEQPLSVNLAVTSLLSRLAMCPDRSLHCFLLDTRCISYAHADSRLLWPELAKVHFYFKSLVNLLSVIESNIKIESLISFYCT